MCRLRLRFGTRTPANWVIRRIIYDPSVRPERQGMGREGTATCREKRWSCCSCLAVNYQDWARIEIDKLSGRRKSMSLPAGTLGFRSEKSKLIVCDEAAVISWARMNCPAAIQTVEQLLKTPINDYFATTRGYEMESSFSLLRRSSTSDERTTSNAWLQVVIVFLCSREGTRKFN